MAVSRRRKIIHRVFAGFWTIVIAWMVWNMQARNLPAGVLESDSRVSVTRTDNGIRFMPSGGSVSTGIVFYPGALADPEAYTPLCRLIAEAGFEVRILELPYRLAPLDRHRRQLADQTLSVVGAGDGPARWVVGGHSKGGKLAAEFAGDHPGVIDGLLLVGTSHPRERDLSGLHMDITKIYASEDGLASVREVDRFSSNLPDHTEYVLVDGGNHAGFGFYGRQIGDGTARIDRSEQLRLTVHAALSLMRRVDSTVNRPPDVRIPPA